MQSVSAHGALALVMQPFSVRRDWPAVAQRAVYEVPCENWLLRHLCYSLEVGPDLHEKDGMEAGAGLGVS